MIGSPTKLKVGDLVYHRHDYFLQIGFGIVISQCVVPNRVVVCWIRSGIIQEEPDYNLFLAGCAPDPRAL